MLHAITTHVQFCVKDSRRIAAETPPHGVGKFPDTISPQGNGHCPVLGAYDWPRFQLGDLVMVEVDR